MNDSKWSPSEGDHVTYVGPAGNAHNALVCAVNADGTVNLIYVNTKGDTDHFGRNRSELAFVGPLSEDRRRHFYAENQGVAKAQVARFDRALEKKQSQDQAGADKLAAAKAAAEKKKKAAA